MEPEEQEEEAPELEEEEPMDTAEDAAEETIRSGDFGKNHREVGGSNGDLMGISETIYDIHIYIYIYIQIDR